MIGWSPSSIVTSSSVYFHRIPNFGIGVLTDVTGGKHLSITANSSVGVHGGFMWKDRHRDNYTSFQVGFQRNKACYSFKNPFGYSFKGDTVTAWVEADSYLKYALSVMRTWHFKKGGPENSCWYAKVSFGQTFFHRDLGKKWEAGYAEDWTEKGTGLKLNVLSSNPKSWMLSVEAGRKFILDNGHMLDIGLVCHAPFADTRTVQYEFFRQNTSLGKSRITFSGATVMLNLAYSFNYRIKGRPVDTTAVLFDDLANKPADSTGTHHEGGFHHHKVNGRHYEVQESVTVSSDLVTVLVWDKNRVDGDEISLYLNGKPVLENYTVSKTKKEVTLKLEPGSNILVMHALNLGRIPPNTAALSINDGSSKKKNITLVSDLHKSGALEIIYTP